MSVLNRITTLIRANINDALERAENPEVMLDQILGHVTASAKPGAGGGGGAAKLIQRDLEQARATEVAAQRRTGRRPGDDAGPRVPDPQADYEANAQAQERMLAAQEPTQQLKSELALLESVTPTCGPTAIRRSLRAPGPRTDTAHHREDHQQHLGL